MNAPVSITSSGDHKSVWARLVLSPLGVELAYKFLKPSPILKHGIFEQDLSDSENQNPNIVQPST